MRAVDPVDHRKATLERRESILSFLESGVDSVASLSSALGVSSSTIRRDLAKLHSSGLIARTYGGAVPAPRGYEGSLTERQTQHRSEKKQIARFAASLVESGDTVYLDGGTTVIHMLGHFGSLASLRIVTPSLVDVDRYTALTNCSVIIVGGELRVTSKSTMGTFAEETLEHLTFDHAFLGADGIDSELGLCERDISQIRMKELVMARSAKSHILVDSSKLDYRPFHAWAPLTGTWEIITDSGANRPELAEFRAQIGDGLTTVPTIASAPAGD